MFLDYSIANGGSAFNTRLFGSGSARLAAIIYDGTLLNIAATRYLKDVGASPQDNSTNYSGRAKQFATDMSMPITVAIGQHLYKFDYDTDTFVHYEILGAMTTYHLGKVDGSGAFENKTYGLVVVFTSELSDADLYLMSVDPEALVKMVALDVADTRFTVTKSDCSVCMTLTEDGKYSRNYAVDLGSNTIDAIAPTMTNTAGGATVVFSSDTSNDFDLAVTAVGTSQNNPAVKTNSVDTGDGKKYILSFDLVVNSGTCIFNTVYAYLTQPYGWSVNTELTTGRHLFIVDVSGTNDHAQMYFDGTNLFDISVTNWEIRELTASELNNYTTLPAPDIRTLNTGLQTTPFKLDSLGMIDAVGDGMEWHGEEYGTSPFNPSEYSEFIVEEIIDDVFYSHIYDGINLTTWTDGIEGTPSAHTPENANYLLGKGVYPKVAADSLAEYTNPRFKVVLTASRIDSYDAAQEYEDWLIESYGIIDEDGNYFIDEDGAYILQDY